MTQVVWNGFFFSTFFCLASLQKSVLGQVMNPPSLLVSSETGLMMAALLSWFSSESSNARSGEVVGFGLGIGEAER